MAPRVPQRGRSSAFTQSLHRIRRTVCEVPGEPPLAVESTTSILFVCTGNICRSPMAEYIARDRLDSTTGFSFSSAGTMARPGQPATDHAQEASAAIGVNLAAHRARPLGAVSQPDFVFGMDQTHLIAARSVFPELAKGSIRLLDHPSEVADPYGYDLATYETARDVIVGALDRVDFDSLRKA
ncbi:MAG: hypothetical protein ACR2N2_03265 [Acidimicrobiia bacterium]